MHGTSTVRECIKELSDIRRLKKNSFGGRKRTWTIYVGDEDFESGRGNVWEITVIN